MGTKTKTVGGGAATGLADNFVKFLNNGLNTGTFGTGGSGTSVGIGGFLNNLFSSGAGNVGGALQSMINTQNTNNVNDLRARFGAGGGTGLGTPAAYAEAAYRAQEPAQTTTAIGNLQLQALSPILSSIFGLSQKGLPQAETITEPSTFSQIVQGLGSIAGPIASAFTPVTAATGAGQLPPVSLEFTPPPAYTPNLGMY